MTTISKEARDLVKLKEKKIKGNDEESKELELFKNTIADRLKDSILSRYSLSEFAKKCNLSYDTLKKYVNKKRLIRADNLVVIAKELGVSCDYLLGITIDVTNNQTTQNGLLINEAIQKETNLSPDAISVLLSYKNESDYINCINTLLSEKTILKRLVKYFIFLQNKGVYIYNAKNQEKFQKYENMVNSTETELESLPEYEHLPIGETINLENVYLYQLMKEIEDAVEKKVKKNR